MSKKIFVGGLSWGTDDDALQQAFSRFGAVDEATIITDRETGRSRGFGFVTFDAETSADEAVAGMNGTDLDYRTLQVDLAQDKPSGGVGGSNGYRNDRW